MAKAAPRDIPSLLKRLPESVRAVLVFGKDEGLIRERRDALASQIVKDPADPFATSRLEPEAVAVDSAKLADEMGAVSMLGGRRLVRLEGAADRVTEAVENALAQRTGDTLLLVTAGDLSPRSTLRAFFEGGDGVLSIACYPDSEQGLNFLIERTLRENRIRAEAGVIDYLAAHLGGDRAVTRSELDKIALYLGASPSAPETTLTLEAVQALTGDSAELTLWSLAAAATGTDAKRLASLLDRAREEGIGAIEILRTLESRLQQMHLVQGLIEDGTPLSEALKALRPPLFFKDRDIFLAQIRNWPRRRLTAALSLAVKTEVACKATDAPDFALAAKACFDLCAAAQGVNRR